MFSAFWVKAKGRSRWKEECQQYAHYTVHLSDTCTPFRSISSDSWLFTLSLSQPPKIHSWAVSLTYGLHIIMHIPFYTALKWWAPGSLPTYLNQPLPKEAGERRRAEAGWPDWGRGVRARAAGSGAGSSAARPSCCPVCAPGAGVPRDAQVQSGHTSVPVAARAGTSLAPRAARAACRRVSRARHSGFSALAFMKDIYTLQALRLVCLQTGFCLSPRRWVGKGRCGLTALAIFRKTCRVCTLMKAPWLQQALTRASACQPWGVNTVCPTENAIFNSAKFAQRCILGST